MRNEPHQLRKSKPNKLFERTRAIKPPAPLNAGVRLASANGSGIVAGFSSRIRLGFARRIPGIAGRFLPGSLRGFVARLDRVLGGFRRWLVAASVVGSSPVLPGFPSAPQCVFPPPGLVFFGLWSRGFFGFLRGLPSGFPRFSVRFPGF